MAKSAGVIIARVLVALIILAGIGACIYFFVIKNDNVRGAVNVQLTEMLNSDNQNKLLANIGGLESGNYYNFNKNISDQNFDDIYLNFYMDNQILNTYNNLLIYVGNKDNAKANAIKNSIENYEKLLDLSLRRQSLFNETYNKADTENSVLVENFKSMTLEFKKLVDEYHNLTKQTFNYVTEYFYKNVDAKKSQKYVLAYGNAIQSEILNNAINSEEEVSVALYEDSKAMIKNFVLNKESGFSTQSSNSDVAEFIKVFSNPENDFTAFLESTNKATYYNDANESAKSNLYIVIRGFGLTGRV